MSYRTAGVAAVVVSLAFSALGIDPGHAQTSGSGSPPLSSAPAPTASDPARNERLRAASEPFEKLTEISFDQSLAAIDRVIVEAQTSVAGLGNALSADVARQVGQQLSALRAARTKADRVALALSSIEIYRLLVTATSPGAKIPTEVYLLDYAGLRCNADLKAVPVRWDDMAPCGQLRAGKLGQAAAGSGEIPCFGKVQQGACRTGAVRRRAECADGRRCREG